MKVNRNICPRKAFCQDLVDFIRLLVQEEFSIVAALDANKDMIIGSIARSFSALGFIDLIAIITSAIPPVTHIRES